MVDIDYLKTCVEEIHNHLVTFETFYNEKAAAGTVYEFVASLNLIESSPDYQMTLIVLRLISTNSGGVINQVKWKLSPEVIREVNALRRDLAKSQISKLIADGIIELHST